VKVLEVVRSVRPCKGAAVCANRFGSATTPFITPFLGGVVPLQRETHQQLRSTEARPAAGCFIQRLGEVVGFGHEVPRASSGHTGECSTKPLGATPCLRLVA